MSRLSVVDEIFLRSHRGLGTPIAMQGIWRTADQVAPDLLAELHSRLRVSALGRRVVIPRVPGARPRWQPSVRAYPLDYRHTAVSPARVAAWAWSVVPELDPEHGPGWHLAAAPIAAGGTAVALSVSHVLADARGMLLAVADALTGRTRAVAEPVDSDWADAGRQYRIAVGGTIGALVRGGRPPATPAVERRPAPADPIPRSAILDIHPPDWAAAAASRAVSGNSLFVAVAANILWGSGFDNDVIDVALPVDERRAGATDVANQLRMATTALRRGAAPTAVQDACRVGYARPAGPPNGFPAELLGVLPRRLAYRLSAGAGERDLLCSDIGRLPNELATLGRHRADAVAARAVHPRLPAARFPRTRLSAYLCRGPQAHTLALVSLDPDRVVSDDALTALARTELAALGVETHPW
ncbi:hypothetical protein [Skermania piniformis]|uniref:Diacylglycerol O-acyltransferase n=1 Tax=Skermania pinensis TaxID=39122 RepID=A0ABX8SC07_9ACTN|nr:hypothetical protein [Skermania piniformis]QXQ13231.1 hypothetical protein KV203_15295 [Skermania piniformis]